MIYIVILSHVCQSLIFFVLIKTVLVYAKKDDSTEDVIISTVCVILSVLYILITLFIIGITLKHDLLS